MKSSGAPHSNDGVVVICDVEDRIVLMRRLPDEPGAILATLAPCHDELRCGESTYKRYWRVDGLIDARYRAHLEHVAAIKRS
jgi:hypothetical protein